MTKKALSEATGISVRSLTAYEHGTQQPNALSLARLADALDFPVEFLTRPHISSPSFEGSSFRALKRMTATQRDQAIGSGALAKELADWIGERFDLPKPTIPRYRGLEPEIAAQAVRDEWGIGLRPIRNMIHLLEAHGVRVFSLAEETREVDAFSTWIDDIPYVFLNTAKTAERSRMDAAHELGHLVLHARDEVLRGRDEERDANEFGAAFLMPASTIKAHAPRGARIKDLVRAKRRWNVAVANLAYRMHKLGVLTEWQFRSVFSEISARGWRTQEPNGIPQETSQVLGKVFQALRDEGMAQADVARELALPTAELQKLVFGLVLTPVEGDGERGTGDRPDLRLVN
jgi:Zn-dependent peptidase ImmA (M78 family)